jgi:dihydrofolate reductase
LNKGTKVPRRTSKADSNGLANKEKSMQELLVDFITSLDGYGAAEGWPGWWGLEGPEYLAWLSDQPEGDYTILMGANTYRLMYGFVTESDDSESGETTDEGSAMDELTNALKVVFSASLQDPLSWANGWSQGMRSRLWQR